MKATEISKKEDATKCAQLLTLMGEEALRIYNSFNLPEAEKEKFDSVIAKFDEYFFPKKHLTFERHKFLTCRQQESQTIQQFINELKNLSTTCELGDIRDSLVKVVCGLRSEAMKERDCCRRDCCRRTSQCWMKPARFKMCVNIENRKQHCRQITNRLSAEEKEVDAVRTKHAQFHPGRQREAPHSRRSSKRQCRRCGTLHGYRSCPVFGKTCRKCGVNNHFANCCISNRKSANLNTANKNIYALNTIESVSEDNFLFIGSIGNGESMSGSGVEEVPGSSWVASLSINDRKRIEFKIDTGATK